MINFYFLPEKTRLLLEKLSYWPFVADFYLAGGTPTLFAIFHRFAKKTHTIAYAYGVGEIYPQY